MTANAEISIRDATILRDEIIPACHPWSAVVRKGQFLRLIDLDGQQAIDFLCFNADDPAERYHAPNTIKVQGNIYLSKGSVLRSVEASAMMTIVEDTCGHHDTIFGCCSFKLDEVRYGQTNARCCQKNFEDELSRHGLGPEFIVPNVNFFMTVPVQPDGSAAIADGLSNQGDYVDLRADMNVLAVLSNCPEALNAATGSGPSPIRAIIFQRD